MARPRKVTACEHCGTLMSAREHRAHKCTPSRPGRPPAAVECETCGQTFTATEIQYHECVPAMDRNQLIGYICRLVASGQAGYRIGREWGKERLGLTLRDRLERRSTEQLRSIAAGNAGKKTWNAGRCIICNHAEREAIEKALAEGVSRRGISKLFGMNKQSVTRHIDHYEQPKSV